MTLLLNKKKLKLSMIFFIALTILSPVFSAENLSKVVNKTLADFNRIIAQKRSLASKKIDFLKIYNYRFAHRKLARNILKREWKKLSSKQKSLFSKKISRFIFLFYFNKLKIYGKADVKVLKIKYSSSKKRAKVYTKIKVKSSQFNANYTMILKKGIWKFYDVEIEGIRISSTYRPQFQRVLRKENFNVLIKKLNKLILQYSK